MGNDGRAPYNDGRAPYNRLIVVLHHNAHSLHGLFTISPKRFSCSQQFCILKNKVVKVSSYIAQYPILRIAQGALHSLQSVAAMVNQIPSGLLWEAQSHAAINARRLFVYKHSPMSIVRYSVIQLSELEQCRMKKPCPMITTVAQDSNPYLFLTDLDRS